MSKLVAIHGRDHRPGGADPIPLTLLTRYSNEIINDPVGGLVLYWKLDELGNTTVLAVDSSGNGNDGGYGSGTAHPTLGVAALADGTAATFDGSDDIVAIGGPTSPQNQLCGFGSMSIEFWTKTTAIGGAQTFVGSDTSSADGRFFKVLLNGDGTIQFAIFDTGASRYNLDSASVVNDGARHHIVCTFDGTDQKIYIDGVLDATATPAMGFPLADHCHGMSVGMGMPQGGGFFVDFPVAATIDEVALYTIALPPDSVQTHFLVGETASNPPSGTAGGVVGGNYPDPEFNPLVAGAGLGINGTNDVLSVNVDGTTIEINSDTLRIKDVVTAGGPTGDSTHVAQITYNAKGQITAVSSVAIAFPTPTDVAIPTPSATTTGDGIKRDLTAGETLAFGDPVYIKSDGKVWKGDADTAGTFPAVGMAMGSAAANATVTVLLLGIARNDSWAWTVGGIVYLSTSSGLTQTQPSATDNAIQIVGIAEAATRIYVNPQLVWITHT